ncbi:hypothetical protein EV182_006112, partial [Spiromyces aspiralis]
MDNNPLDFNFNPESLFGGDDFNLPDATSFLDDGSQPFGSFDNAFSASTAAFDEALLSENNTSQGGDSGGNNGSDLLGSSALNGDAYGVLDPNVLMNVLSTTP